MAKVTLCSHDLTVTIGDGAQKGSGLSPARRSLREKANCFSVHPQWTLCLCGELFFQPKPTTETQSSTEGAQRFPLSDRLRSGLQRYAVQLKPSSRALSAA